MGWAGLVMVPVLYALIEAIPFTAPTNPGLIPPYPRHRNLPRSEQANIARQHQIDMNYWNSWLNIYYNSHLVPSVLYCGKIWGARRLPGSRHFPL